MIEPGKILADRYAIVGLIGKGGMGSVYEARHIHIGKRVAVKVLAKDYSKNAEALERFQQEAQIAGSIGHINICEVMDFGKTDENQPFLVMEYLEGRSLADILAKDEKLPVDVALDFTMQILDALEEVHGKGILHRDLKPENAFVTNVKGHGQVVKILDFGISKIMKSGGGQSVRLTKTGAMIGTPYYMSPEQVRAKGDVDHRTDIYSCAVMLYEMITGGVPYGGDGYSQIIAAIIEDPFPDPQQMWPDLPPPVVELIRWGMEKDPLKRPRSAAEFREKILEVRNALPDARPAPIHKKTPAYVSTKMNSMVVSPTAQEGRGRAVKVLYIVGAFAAALMIAGGVLLTVFSGGWSKKRQPPPDEVKVLVHGTAPAQVQPPAVPPEGVGQLPEKVLIQLENAPEDVRILYHGEEKPRALLEVQGGREPIHFTIKADGFSGREVEVVPSKDMKVDGKLEPSPAEKPKKADKKKKKTEGGAAETKKKGLGHVWDYP